MDENQAIATAAHDLQGPHFARTHEFRPLRLILRPSGVMVELTRPDMVLGRHSGADVRLPLPDVSRRHCRFVFNDGEWHVRDLDSMNGIYVNEEQVQQTTLHHHDALRIGGFTFDVDLGEAATPEGAILRSIANALPQEARAAS
jgi:pSer/pThr/pTyr-binding forkhead associated (FHA) protein